MGIVTSNHTRRISFDNTFAINSALALQTTIKGENPIVFENLATETENELEFKDKHIPGNKQQGDGDYWSWRVENLKKEHQLINQIIETEYEKKINSINSICEPPKVTHEKLLKLNPCFQMRTKMIQCYTENPHQPLKCSEAVQAFSNCVAYSRAED